MPYVGNKSTTFNTFSATDVSVTDDLTVTDDASVGGDLTVTGDLVISGGGSLDVFNSGNSSTDLTALLGADNGSGYGRTNSTTKVAVIGMPHYTNAEEAVGLIVAGSLSGESFIELGGGSSAINAATSVHIRTASDTTSTGGTQRLTVNSSGDIDVETGDIFFSTAGKGIVLGATSNTAANTLDDYEEGTFNLLMQGGNSHPSSDQNLAAQYTKVGNTVHFNAMDESINNTGALGPIYFSGLPFASTGAYGIGNMASSHVATFTGDPYAVVSGTIVYIFQSHSEALNTVVTHHVDTGGKFYLFGSYKTTA